MTLEELQEQVAAISAAVSELRASGISERALLILIQQAAPALRGARYGSYKKVPIRTIRAVLDGIEDLSSFLTTDNDDEESSEE